MKQKRGIAILGSTGSIGRQAVEIIRECPGRFSVEMLSAHNNAKLLIEQALECTPNAVVIVNPDLYNDVNDVLFKQGIKVYSGEEALLQAVCMEGIDIVLASIVGFAGLRSTIAAIRAGKQIALANKETLVVAGELVTRTAREKGVNIYPVDSEHSAIFQCMTGEFHNEIEKIYLTGSGGPFRGWKQKELLSASKAQALKHPNWNMGDKITIDSASLMNKGLEVIEAKWLFGLKPEQIEVIIHPQSIIHSMVQFKDGSIKAQMGLPDMKLPILYALNYPERLPTSLPRIDFAKCTSLEFEKPDTTTFRNLALAYEALKSGGNMPCVLNAANEIAVTAFLEDRIGFMKIPEIIECCINRVSYIKQPELDDYLSTDKETRQRALEMI